VISLNLSSFLDTPQFTPEQVLQTETIAKAIIRRVERAIQRIKCFSILNFIPSNLETSRTDFLNYCCIACTYKFTKSTYSQSPK
jgi:hypothetical protein